jgi:predicted RNA-binding Zn ribbon-like protein
MDKKIKIQAAIDALPNVSGGNWWCEELGCGYLFSDPSGSVKIAKYVDGGSAEERAANKSLLSAARELAEEVLRLRELLTKAGHVVGALQGGVPCEDDIEFIRCSIEGEGL